MQDSQSNGSAGRAEVRGAGEGAEEANERLNLRLAPQLLRV